MKKAVSLVLSLLLCVCIFGGCGAKDKKNDSEQSKISEQAKNEENSQTSDKDIDGESSETSAEEGAVLPSDFPMELVFSSGAGGWRSVITLNSDGSFEGEYSDSEMGDTGKDYPNGSYYISNFSGRFSSITKNSDNTYNLLLGDVSLEEPKDKEWIKDGIRYIAAEAYGFEKGKEFVLYPPETPVNGLSEEFLSWWPLRYQEKVPDTLAVYGLLNKETGYGFFGEQK